MNNLLDLVISVQPFSAVLFQLLDVSSTIALSRTCKPLQLHIQDQVWAFSNVDLRDSGVVSIINRSVEHESRVPRVGVDAIGVMSRFSFGSLDATRLQRICLLAALHACVLQRRVSRVNVLRLDGVQVSKWLLKQVLTTVAPNIKELGLVFTTSGLTFEQLVRLFEEKRFRRLEKLWV